MADVNEILGLLYCQFTSLNKNLILSLFKQKMSLCQPDLQIFSISPFQNSNTPKSSVIGQTANKESNQIHAQILLIHEISDRQLMTAAFELHSVVTRVPQDDYLQNALLQNTSTGRKQKYTSLINAMQSFETEQPRNHARRYLSL